jgi:hypothetical protein
MEHLEENILALYVLDAPELKERRAEIAAHLDQCAGCAQLRNEMQHYYADVEVIQAKKDESVYPALQVSSGIARSPRDLDRGPLPSLSRSAAQNLVTSIKTYPVRWSGGFALVVAALLLLIPRLFVLDKNPEYTRAKDEFLIALNKNGDELWRRYIGPGFESATKPVLSMPRVMDLDADGSKEIIVVAPPGPFQLRGWVGCFNADGSDRWRFEFHPRVDFGKEAFSGDYELESSLPIRDPESNGKYEIAFSAHHITWWPSVIGLLDAKDGRTLSEYWHPGWIKLSVKDVDGDGKDEIIALGYNNAFNRNVLAVLDPRKISGCAPATPEYTPQGMIQAAEKFYILLPDPDLFELPNRLSVAQGAYRVESADLEVRTVRYFSGGSVGNRAAEVFFDFDDRLNCVKVKVADEFVNLHRQFKKEGKIKTKLDDQYFENLRREVMYWDGQKFVKEPTMNKKYMSGK